MGRMGNAGRLGKVIPRSSWQAGFGAGLLALLSAPHPHSSFSGLEAGIGGEMGGAHQVFW